MFAVRVAAEADSEESPPRVSDGSEDAFAQKHVVDDLTYEELALAAYRARFELGAHH